MIRWALYLHCRSSGAYETLQKSGVIALPSSRTLRDYRHLSSTSSPGFSVTTDLLDLIKCPKPNLIDEVYLKVGLVYNKSTGSLVDFADLGGIVQQLSDYEDCLSTDSNVRLLAKTMMVFMVRGIFCNKFSVCPISHGIYQSSRRLSTIVANDRPAGVEQYPCAWYYRRWSICKSESLSDAWVNI